ncbi:MAG: SRPBCC family protein [Luteolibacter sp.]
MPAFTVEKSILIEAPPETVFPLVRDFRKWKSWSPWLIAEPEAKLDYRSNPEGYSWEGKVIGSGMMELTAVVPDKSMECRLTFLKPWKSTCCTKFTFTETPGGTRVSWIMEGSLPFFMFFMKSMMKAMIGMDYERGLKMLKDLAETGEVPSVLDFQGEEPVAGFRYVGLKNDGSITEIGKLMEADMKRLGQWIETAGVQPAGAPFTIYDKWDPAKGELAYTMAFPFSDVPESLPDGFMKGEVPDCTAYVVKHTGPYRHLGNAWAAGMMYGRSGVFKQSKTVPPFEIYHSDPSVVTDEKSIETSVYFPVR